MPATNFPNGKHHRGAPTAKGGRSSAAILASPGRRGSPVLLAWTVALIQIAAALATAAWLLTWPAVFDVYYRRLGYGERASDARQVVIWLAHGRPPEALRASMTNGMLSPKELAHFAEVRRLFSKLPILALASWVGLGLVLALIRAREFPRMVLARASLLLALFAVAAMFFAWWDWKVFFAWVHQPFFGPSSWRLPKGSYSVFLFPAFFWRATAIAAIVMTVFLLMTVYAIAALVKRRGRRSVRA